MTLHSLVPVPAAYSCDATCPAEGMHGLFFSGFAMARGESDLEFLWTDEEPAGGIVDQHQVAVSAGMYKLDSWNLAASMRFER